MATSYQWKNVEEYFTCPICLGILDEPKLLTCLHRFCKRCLHNFINKDNSECPVCREEIETPSNGLDGFKTDFLCKNLVEILQNLKLSTEKPLTKEGLKCDIHSENVTEFVCLTCDNCLVCKQCTSNAHEEHEFFAVTTLNEIRRKDLAEAQKVLQKIEEKQLKLYKYSKLETQKVIEICEKDTKEITLEIENMREKMQEILDNGNKKKKDEIAKLKRAEEKKIQEIKEEYKSIFEKRVEEIDEENKALNEPHTKKLTKLYEKLKHLSDSQKSLTQSLETELKDKVRGIEEVSKNLVVRMRQFGDIHTGKEIDNLITRIKSEYETLEKEKMFDIKVDYRGSGFRKKRAPSIADHAETIQIVNTIDSQWYVDGIASNNDGKIAITGSTEDHKSRITLMDLTGMIIKEKKFGKSIFSPGKRRFCDFVTNSKIASVYQEEEIGIYDVADDSYMKITTDFKITCMAVDTAKDLILVGSDDTEVYMFDFELVRRHRKLALPKIIEGPRDISVNKNGRLLVCDYEGSRIYETTLEGSESRAEYEFSRPDLDGEDWKPLCLCSDKYKCIFSLWMTGTKLGLGRRILVQYGDNGRKLLTTKEIDRDSRCATVIDQKDRGKLLIATWKTGQLYSYDLIYEDPGQVGV